MTSETDNKDKDQDLHDEVKQGHNYDGIDELDNPPPRWIMNLFYITIGLSILYGAYFFWLRIGDNQDQEYARKSAKHDLEYKKNTPAVAIKLLEDAGSLNEGQEIYVQMGCVACHGNSGEGNAIGPNLTDDNWINGCSFDNVVNIVKNGNSVKGMTAFKDKLSDEKVAKVASFVLLKLKGSKPANPKPPQGEPCK